VAEQLHGRGLRLRTGPFTYRIRTRLDRVARNLKQLYGPFPVADEHSFADFDVTVRLSSGLRRIYRTQSIFEVDGHEPFKPLPGRQAFAILEWGMNWCIYSHAHHYLIIHGAVLEKSGRAVLLPAPSGSGKSTLCAALMCRGWRLLSDELILIRPEDGAIMPLCRPISLKNRSIDIMRDFAPDALITEPIPDTTKGTVAHMRPNQLSFDGLNRPAHAWRVVFPRYVPNAETTAVKLPRADTFMRLIENAFNYSILGTTGFHTLAGVVDRLQGMTVEYSSMASVIELLETELAEAPA